MPRPNRNRDEPEVVVSSSGVRTFVWAMLLTCCAAIAATAAEQPTSPPPVVADDPETAVEAEDAEESATDDQPSPLVGAVWCAVESGDPWLAADQPDTEQVEGEEPAAPETVDACDGGVGLALWRWRRFAPVAVIGTKTVGVGIAYVAHRTAGGRAFAVALGVVTPWDANSGISSDARLALGATFSFGGPPQ